MAPWTPEKGNYEVRTYEPDDFKFFASMDMELAIGKPTHELAKLYQNNGPSITALYKGEPFAMAGLNIMWTGTAEAWALFAPGFSKHGVFIHRTAIRMLNIWAIDHKLKRIQAAADQNHEAACVWLDALGFNYEAPMPYYFNNRTFIRFAKLFLG